MSTVAKKEETKENIFEKKNAEMGKADMTVKGEDVSEMVKTNPQGLEIDDPVVYRDSNKSITGKITQIHEENGVMKFDISPYSSSANPIRVKANDPKLDPLFFKAKDKKKVYTRFSYNELRELLRFNNQRKNKIFGLTWEDLERAGKAFNSLMLGNRTEVIDNLQMSKPRETEGQTIDEKFNVSARLELRRTNSGQAYVHAEFKQLELNLDAPFYGRTFSDEEKKTLKETGELGLVSDFVNQKTGEFYKLWVSVDNKLNKVVSRRENDIKIEKIYGTETSKEQRANLSKGIGQVVEIKKTDGTKKPLFIQPSAASTKNDGLRTFGMEKAKELGLLDEKKKEKSKSRRVGA